LQPGELSWDYKHHTGYARKTQEALLRLSGITKTGIVHWCLRTIKDRARSRLGRAS